MNDQTVAIQPVVNWPRTARLGQDYLVTVDVVLAEAAQWPYEREEFVVGCVLEGGARFAVEALGSTSVVLHRFGGTYGPVRFVVRAERDLAADGSGGLRLTLVTEGGLPFAPIELPVLPDGADAATTDAAYARWTVAPLHTSARRPTTMQPRADVASIQPTTRRRALLIGAAVRGLSGIEKDLDALREVLTRRAFDVSIRTGPAATRADIIAAYEELIDQTKPGDAVVVYYAGHGGLVRPPLDAGTQPALQFIVPTDYGNTTADDFRGITFIELAVLVGRLTDITHNVTEIFDCSHAGRTSWTWDAMSYGAPVLMPASGDPPASIPEGPSKSGVPYDLVAGHVAMVMNEGFATHLGGPIENAHAVRIVACAAEQSAFEYRNHDGVTVSVFTEALVLALEETAGRPVAWSTVLELVRRRVLTLIPSQRPDVEGPSRRVPFELQEVDAVSSLPVVAVGSGRVVLEGARLLAVQVGDEFTVVLPGSIPAAGSTVLGTARVERIAALSAEAVVTLIDPAQTLPIGAVAVPEPGAGGLVGVRMPGDQRWAALLTEAMAASPLVRPAGPEEETGLAVDLDASGRSAVSDRIGPLTAFAPADQAEAGRTVENLERIARAAAVRWLEAPFDARLDGPIAVEWGLVAGGVKQPLPLSGGVLRVGERVYISVRNGSGQRLYVSVIDVGVSSSVTLLTANGQSGFAVAPGGEFLLADRGPDGRLTGNVVGWPTGFPAQFARPTSIVVLVTSQPLAVGVLQQAGVRNSAGADALRRPAIRPATSMRRRPEGGAPPAPDPEPAAVRSAGGLSAARPAPMRYAVHTIDFLLQPTAPPAR